MTAFSAEDFVRILKYGTLLHHHGPIDHILLEFLHTRDYEQFAHDLIVQTGSMEVVLESAYLAASSDDNPFVTVPCPTTKSPHRACNDIPSPPDPMQHPYRTRTRSRGS